MTTFHFFNVGQGNMVLGVFSNSQVLVYDCNITDENEAAVFTYLQSVMPAGKKTIDVFVNSHRDADHMRGIKKLHAKYPIGTIWDSGVSGNADTPEYKEYMNLRRSIPYTYEVGAGQHWAANPNVQILNGKREGLEDPNSQSIVLHVDDNGSSLLLAGDTTVASWRDYIVRESGTRLRSLVLYASHHGSSTFFNENPDVDADYTHHLALMNPAIAVISVGADNRHGHPDDDSLTHFANHCYGTVETRQKVFRTDEHGNMMLELHGNGTGTIYWNR